MVHGPGIIGTQPLGSGGQRLLDLPALHPGSSAHSSAIPSSPGCDDHPPVPVRSLSAFLGGSGFDLDHLPAQPLPQLRPGPAPTSLGDIADRFAAADLPGLTADRKSR